MKKKLIGFFTILMLLVLWSIPANAAYYKKRAYQRLSGGPYITGEDIVVGEAIMIADADGYVYLADSSDATRRGALGLAGNNAASGAYVEVVLSGIFSGWTGLTEGAVGYLSETPGAITQTAPTWTQAVAYAITSTTYFVVVMDTTADIRSLGELTGATPIILDGATDDTNELTFSVADPTADRTLKLGDVSGRNILGKDEASVDNVIIRYDGVTGFLAHQTGVVIDDNNDIIGVQDVIEFEGSAADAHETQLTVINPTADRTVKIGNESGRILVGPDGAATDNIIPRFDDTGGYLMQSSGISIDDSDDIAGVQDRITFEGATDGDAHQINLDVGDPIADVTVTIPAWFTSDVPVIVTQDYADHSANNETTDGTSVTVPANALVAGMSLEFTLGGTLVGTNVATNVILYIDNAAILTLDLSPADLSSYNGWYAQFTLMGTAGATQRVGGSVVASDDVSMSEYATDTTDATAQFIVKTQVKSSNVGDTITQTFCTVKYLP